MEIESLKSEIKQMQIGMSSRDSEAAAAQLMIEKHE